MTMREKIARICQPTGWSRRMTNGPAKDYLKELGFQKADAILDALAEPTEGMIVAGIIERHDSGTPEAWKLATANIFKAMIARAKEER